MKPQRRTFRSVLCAVLGAAVAAGCGGGAVSGTAASEVVEFFTLQDGVPVPNLTPPEPLIAPLPSKASWHVGVRGEMLRHLDAGCDAGDADAMAAGLVFRRAPAGRIGFEFGGAYTLGEADRGILAQNMRMARMGVLVMLGSGRGAAYVSLGGAAYIEENNNIAIDEDLVGVRGAGEVGFGFGARGGQIDVRFTYVWLSIDDEMENLAGVSVGLGF